jgi:hypothetical protein
VTNVQTSLLIALALVALGGLGLLVRNSRAAIVALGIQWLGLILALDVAPSGSLLFTVAGGVELIVAAACVVLAWTTLNAAGNAAKIGAGKVAAPPQPKAERPALSDYALPAAVVLLGGITGFGLALLAPLSGTQPLDLVFYWTLVSSVVVIMLDGARDPIKAALGLLALLNGAAFLVSTLSVTAPGPGLLGLLAVSRVGLMLVSAFGWLWLQEAYGEISFEPLFGRRDAELSTETTLAVVGPTGDRGDDATYGTSTESNADTTDITDPTGAVVARDDQDDVDADDSSEDTL